MAVGAKPRVPLTLVEYPEHDQSKSFHSGLLRIPERRTSVVSEFRIRPRAGSERLIIVMLNLRLSGERSEVSIRDVVLAALVFQAGPY